MVDVGQEKKNKKNHHVKSKHYKLRAIGDATVEIDQLCGSSTMRKSLNLIVFQIGC
jgi:hypothetical protein